MNNRTSFSLIANLFLLLFLGVVDNQMISPLLPLIQKSFGVDVTTVGALVVAYSIAAACSALLSGALSDHYGRKAFLVSAAIGFAVFSLLTHWAYSFAVLLVLRFLVGLCAGTISTCTIALASDTFPYEIRGRAIGTISSAYFAALILGVPIGSLAADRFEWRTIFPALALVALLIAVTNAIFLPPRKIQAKAADSDLLRTRLKSFMRFFSKSDLLASVVMAFFVSGGIVGLITYIGVWLNTAYQIPIRWVGIIFLLSGVVSLVGAPLGGVLSDRWGKRRVSMISCVLLAVAILLIPMLHWGVALFAVFGLVSLGAAFRQGPITALITELVDEKERGAFVALRNISSQLGIASAAFLGGILYQTWGYTAVAILCSGFTLVVVWLLAQFIQEPHLEHHSVVSGPVGSR
ncbi:MAG: MFS transporter [Acidobacteriia bacterium]|nr:MFS transporter [Terriglobia bacterium]